MKAISLLPVCAGFLAGAFHEALRAADPAPGAPETNYVYHAKVVRVIDANTVALDVDLGFRVWLHNQWFVLQGVPAPPPGADKAAMLAASARTREVLPKDEEVVLQSIRDKSDTSGAYHAVLWKDDVNLNERIAGRPRAKP